MNIKNLTLQEVLKPSNIVSYWENTDRTQAYPYLGLTLFGLVKTNQLTVEQVTGKKGIPVTIQPSVYDAKPLLRQKIGFKKTYNQMPFFREAGAMSEQETQDLVTTIASAPEYVKAMLPQIYDSITPIIEGAEAQKERMIMQLLTNMKIRMQSDNDQGIQESYDYDYAFGTDWEAENVTVLTGKDRWLKENSATSKPIQTIVETLDEARSKGEFPTKAIISTNTLNAIMASNEVRADMMAGVVTGQLQVMSRAKKVAYLEEATGITFLVYDKVFTDRQGGETMKFYPDGQITLIPEGLLGDIMVGRTPDEFFNDNQKYMGGLNSDIAPTKTADTGVTVASKMEVAPYNLLTTVSMVALPRLNDPKSIFVIKNAGA